VTDVYTLSLHDALPICRGLLMAAAGVAALGAAGGALKTLPGVLTATAAAGATLPPILMGAASAGGVLAASLRGVGDAIEEITKRSEEHTSELQSRENLV